MTRQEGSGGLVALASVSASQLWCSAHRIQSEARVKTGAVTTRMEACCILPPSN